MKLSLLILLSCMACLNACAGEIHLDGESKMCFSDGKQCILVNEESQKICKVFDHLERACALAQSIPDEEGRASVFESLKWYEKRLKAQFVLKNYQNLKDTTESLYENLGEILAECNDLQIRQKISFCISEMMECLDENHPED